MVCGLTTISKGGRREIPCDDESRKLSDADVDATNHVWSSGASSAAGCPTLLDDEIDVVVILVKSVILVVLVVVVVVVLLARLLPSCFPRSKKIPPEMR